MSENTQPADQTDIVAANEKLTDDLATTTKDLDDARASLTVVTKERDDAKASLATTTTERDQALADLAKVTAERDALAKTDRDFNTRLAAELAKHGIRADAIAPSASKPAGMDLVAQYQAITDSGEKAAFFAKHGDELRRIAIAS
jgi:chromosome segregation ATPase